jgi:hypothetical protein
VLVAVVLAAWPLVAQADVTVLETPDHLVFDPKIECADAAASPQVVQLLVSRIENGDFLTSWMFTGELEIGQFAYGVAPPGSFEAQAAKELVPGSIYRVRIEYDCGAPEVDAVGALFFVDLALRVVQCSNWWHCVVLEKTAWW